MQIFDVNKNRIGILIGFKDRSITTTLDSGDKEMSFQYPATAALVNDLKEECYIRTKTDEYVLKEINEADDFNTYTATLNVEELESKVFKTGFETVEKTIMECLQIAFDGTGWSIRNCEVTKKRTIRESDQQTAWSVLQKALSTYRCECVIDTLKKKIDIYDRIGEDKGAYFIEGLNLKKMTRKSDTYDFYTRIYPIGKDGLTPETVLGKDYIDNHQYSSKVKACVWKDERYTVVDSLIEDATAKLAEISKPYRQYTAEVQDLAKQSEVYKDILAYGIGDTVTIISKTKGIKDKQRVVKIVEYPETPEKNTVELSNVNKTFAEIQQEEVDAETDRATTEEGNLSDDIADEAETRQDEDSKITVRVEKTEKSIETEVADRSRENLEIATKISQLPHKLSLQATGGEKTVGITIQLYDENGQLIDTTSGAANITVTGFVTFNDLANAGSTTINGANINTGYINCDRLRGGTITGVRFYQEGSSGKVWIEDGFIKITGQIECEGGYVATQNWVEYNAFVQRAISADSAESAKKADTANYAETASYVANTASDKHTANMYIIISYKMYYCPQGSSRRFKNNVVQVIDDRLDPHRLYDIDVVQFQYKPSFYNLPEGTPMETVIGFIAEDIYDKYPVACEFDEDTGAINNWLERYMIPPMLALIQEQHKDIEHLKMKYTLLYGEIEILKQRIERLEEKLC